MCNNNYTNTGQKPVGKKDTPIKKQKPTGDIALDIGMRGSVTFPELELNTSERNEDGPSGVFIIISSPSRLPHFEQELFINKKKSLLWDFTQHNIIEKKIGSQADCMSACAFPTFSKLSSSINFQEQYF